MKRGTQHDTNQSAAKREKSEGRRKADKKYLLQQMLDANPVPYFVIDENHQIIHWSHGCEQILGKRAEEMLGTSNQWMPFYSRKRATLADYIVEDAIGEIIEGPYLDKQVRRSESIAGAFEAIDYFPGLGTSGLWLHFTAAPIRNPAGKIVGAIETLQDVSLQHNADVQLRLANSRLEIEVARRTADLAESHRQLQISLRRAEEIDRLKSMFLSSISSELKTPLNGILGFADLIRMDPKDENVAEFAAEIHESGSTLLRLLNDLLTLSEIAAGQAEMPEEHFSPPEMVSSVISRFSERARTKGITLGLTTGPHCPDLMIGDGKRLQHSLACLVDNAVKFTTHGSVSVDIDGRGPFFIMVVKDTGPGIPEEAEAMIFNQFTQLDRHALPAPGSLGLGLALVKAQAEMMGGTLDVISAPGEGSSFTLALPVRPLSHAARK